MISSRVARGTVLVLAVGALVVACGGGSSPTSPSPSPTSGGSSGSQVRITAAGVSPGEITVSPGTRVTFVNSDTRAHFVASDPHPEHTDCPEINQVGQLQPGQSRETGNFVQARTCGYHDHDQPTNSSLRGRIVVR